jgi:urease accessory protein
MRHAIGSKDIFAANRAAGRVALSVAAQSGRSRRRRVYEDGPLRVRFPHGAGTQLEAVIVNTAGGIAGGDRHVIDITVGENAAVAVTTAAAEKVYRTLGPAAEIGVTLAADRGARVVWLPQETILFDRAHLARRIEVALAADASLLMAEAVVYGRAAMGETVVQGAFADRWRVRRDGRLIFAEATKIDGAVAARLAQPAAGGGANAFATVLAVPGDAMMVERVRAQGFAGEVGASAWNGIAAARLCAKDGATLRADLAAVIAAFGGVLPRLWLN